MREHYATLYTTSPVYCRGAARFLTRGDLPQESKVLHVAPIFSDRRLEVLPFVVGGQYDGPPG